MARLAGMSSEAFSSPSATGLGSILRDQKFVASGSSSIHGMARLPPVTNHSVSMASPPKEATVLDGDPSTDESDEFIEEDVWAAMESSRSWQHQDATAKVSIENQDRSSSKDDAGELRLGFAVHRHGAANHHPPLERRLSSGAELGKALNFSAGYEKGLEVVMVSSKASCITESFVKNHQVKFSIASETKSPSARSLAARQTVSSTRSMTIPQRTSIDKENRKRFAERQSAPVEVPDWTKIMESRGKKADGTAEKDEDEDERLPPHELLAREYARSQRTTFSVCEGLGRTLKGRDLSRVRNAVWSQMGFAD